LQAPSGRVGKKNIERARTVWEGLFAEFSMKIDGTVRVGVVAADPLRQLGLVTILQESVGLNAIALELVEVAGDRKLGGLLIDVHSCGAALTDIISRLRTDRSEMKIVVVGESLDPELIQAVIGAGAKGYLLETSDEREICMAMDVVLDGSVWAPRKVLARLIDASGIGAPTGAGSSESVVDKMTPREQEVLQLLMDGGSNRQIAKSMGIDEVTVKAHLGRMLRKTGSSNRIELTLRAMEERAAKPEGEPVKR
jgi:DNA-binding NarL/FixJ family response regulator